MKTSALYSLLLLALLFATGCNDDDDEVPTINRNEPENVWGLQYAESPAGDFEAVYSSITSALDAQDAITVVAEVDHGASAQALGTSLGNSRVVLFGNPALGTPLMRINPAAGLDLPQKMHVYTAPDRDVIVTYNSTDYLAQRWGVGDASSINTISQALRNIALDASGGEPVATTVRAVNPNEGVIGRTTELTVDSAYTRLINALNANDAITIVGEVDHQANAASVGQELRPSKLVIFGNPALGTPLMRSERSLGVDLPQKMLVFMDEDSTTNIIYNDIVYLVRRHNADATLGEVSQVAVALDGLAAAAGGN